MYAGVILDILDLKIENFGVPRVCGGDPGSSSQRRKRQSVFPVYAGVILKMEMNQLQKQSVPRVCGGDPIGFIIISTIFLCSPCMRG